MRGKKEHQEICVVGRLFSLEALVFLMGVVSLSYGLAAARLANIIIGALVLVIAVLLARVWRRVQLK